MQMLLKNNEYITTGFISIKQNFLPELRCLPEVKYAHKQSRECSWCLHLGWLTGIYSIFFPFSCKVNAAKPQGNGFVPTWDKVIWMTEWRNAAWGNNMSRIHYVSFVILKIIFRVYHFSTYEKLYIACIQTFIQIHTWLKYRIFVLMQCRQYYANSYRKENKFQG